MKKINIILIPGIIIFCPGQVGFAEQEEQADISPGEKLVRWL